VHDLEGTDGAWQEGVVNLHVPIAVAEDWMNNYEKWPERFPDIKTMKVLKRGEESTLVRFESKILQREMTCDMHISAHKVVYTGTGNNVTVQGKLFFEPFGGQTRVIIQTASELHGGLRLVPKSTAKNRARRKIHGDLEALVVLEQRYLEEHGKK
jgi:carbon monoxide dehydrogenase subunit G